MNPHILGGDLVFIKDHINLQPENPLRGVNDERLGPRFPDMLHTYNAELIEEAMKIANEKGIRAHTGIYVGLQGPNLETPAEYAYMNRIGGDVVGMSTVPEVLVARHMNLPVFVLSVVSNQSYPKEVMREVQVEPLYELSWAQRLSHCREVSNIAEQYADVSFFANQRQGIRTSLILSGKLFWQKLG